MTNQISATAHTASNLATAQPVQDMVPLRQLKFNQPIGFELGGYTVGHAATMSRCNAVGTIVGVEESDGRRTVTLEFSEPQPTDVDGVSSYRFALDYRSITSTWIKPDGDVHRNQIL